MSQLAPAFLGEEAKKTLVLKRESHPLPADRKAILLKVGEILSLGRVQKVVLHVGNPIQVDRFVDSEEMGPQPEIIPADDLWLEARNSPMVEYSYAGSNRPGIETLYNAWKQVIEQGCQVEVIFCSLSTAKSLRRWVGFPVTDNELFGAKVEANKEMPDDSVLLFGSSSIKTFSVRVAIDFPGGQKDMDLL